jgi:hypothetical protein
MERSPMLVDLQNQYCEMSILPKLIYMINAILFKIPIVLITEIEKSTLKSFGRRKVNE